jgi:hypothetical protein
MASLVGPTSEQIATVKTNLARMIAFNSHVYTFGHTKIEVAFKLLSRPDSKDPGFQFGMNLLQSTFRGLGPLGGPLGVFTASVVCGIVSDWTVSKQRDLNRTFVSIDQRFQESIRELNLELGKMSEAVPANWTRTFTYNGKSATLADFADPKKLFPTETEKSQEFKNLADEALHGVDQSVWQEILANHFQITYWRPPAKFARKQDDPPIAWIERFYKTNKAYYETYEYQPKNGCNGFDGYLMHEYSLGGQTSSLNANTISDDAAEYLFIDSVPNKVINKKGVFTREKVFTGLGIRGSVQGPGPMAVVEPQLSFAYLRAMKEGRTLTALIAAEGRESVQNRVIAAAHADSVFAHNLRMRPRPTLEAFLGVLIADVIDLQVTVEGPRSFGLVVPEPPPES